MSPCGLMPLTDVELAPVSADFPVVELREPDLRVRVDEGLLVDATPPPSAWAGVVQGRQAGPDRP
jgi:hypothetical protein